MKLFDPFWEPFSESLRWNAGTKWSKLASWRSRSASGDENNGTEILKNGTDQSFKLNMATRWKNDHFNWEETQ